jgi:hypothetical protein
MQKGEATEEEATLTDWISSNLSLSHESLGRRLQVPLQQVVIDIDVEPVPQATESTQSERRSQIHTGTTHQNLSHLIRFPVALRHSATGGEAGRDKEAKPAEISGGARRFGTKLERKQGIRAHITGWA